MPQPRSDLTSCRVERLPSGTCVLDLPQGRSPGFEAFSAVYRAPGLFSTALVMNFQSFADGLNGHKGRRSIRNPFLRVSRTGGFPSRQALRPPGDYRSKHGTHYEPAAWAEQRFLGLPRPFCGARGLSPLRTSPSSRSLSPESTGRRVDHARTSALAAALTPRPPSPHGVGPTRAPLFPGNTRRIGFSAATVTRDAPMAFVRWRGIRPSPLLFPVNRGRQDSSGALPLGRLALPSQGGLPDSPVIFPSTGQRGGTLHGERDEVRLSPFADVPFPGLSADPLLYQLHWPPGIEAVASPLCAGALRIDFLPRVTPRFLSIRPVSPVYRQEGQPP